MWDLIKDYTNSFIGAIVVLIGLIAIPEIRRNKKLLISSVIIFILLVWLGIDKINRDNQKDEDNKNQMVVFFGKIDSSKHIVDSLNATIKNSNTQTNQFLKRLDSSFNITVDSLRNAPVKKTFNTNIEKARDVYIGDH